MEEGVFAADVFVNLGTMKVKGISIEGVGGIEELTLVPHDTMNIICGPNGIGKTTVLEVISHAFSVGRTNILKRHAKSLKSLVKVTYDSNRKGLFGPEEHTLTFDTFIPDVQTEIQGRGNLSNYVLSLKTARTFQYTALKSVERDKAKNDNVLWNEAILGISLADVKNWFVNRYLYSAHEGALTEEQKANFELAKKCFSSLESSHTFVKVDASSNEIMVDTPTGLIYYEYLSSGFKSILSMLFGIIKEIEYRFVNPRIAAKDFDGVILIDELDLHLHPEWQTRVASVLTATFPQAQFFATTHSPHIIQAASPNQIIALGRDGEKVIQRPLPDSSYGFQGWTIEEVLVDVMGMADTRTDVYEAKMQDFQSSVQADNLERAAAAYETLQRLLHPSSPTRKLIDFQMAGLKQD